MHRRVKPPLPIVRVLAVVAAGLACAFSVDAPLSAQSDLDAFMRQVVERRDDNWRRLQQYILDEREVVDIRGPGGVPVYGEQREYTWFVRDGFFIRSPLVVNGVTISEEERRAYEGRYLRREQLREKRAREARPPGDSAPPQDLDGFIRQTRDPYFVSSAYFLKFKFDEGQYAFVGPETLDGVDTLRVEYYPTLLFADEPDARLRPNGRNPVARQQARTLVNKGSRITLWVLPATHQIVRYTATNVDLDFFPYQWLATVNEVSASMTMTQAFPDVWLPDQLEMSAGLMFAFGPIDVDYRVDYHGYRQAEVTSTIRVPDGP